MQTVERILVSEPLFPDSSLVLKVDRSRPYSPANSECAWSTCSESGAGRPMRDGTMLPSLALTEIPLSAVREIRSPTPHAACGSFLERIWRERPDLVCLDGGIIPALKAEENRPFLTGLKEHMKSALIMRAFFASFLRNPDNGKVYLPVLRHRKGGKGFSWPKDLSHEPIRSSIFLALQL